MKNALYGAGALALLAISAFFSVATWEEHQARLIVTRELAAIHQDADLVLNGDPDSGTSVGMMPLRERLVVAVIDQASGLREDVRGMFGDLRKSTFRELDDIRTDAREQLAGIRTDALAAVDKAAAPVERLRKDLAPTLEHAGNIAKHVDDALPQFTDCAYLDENGEPIGGNPDCAFNRFQGASKAFEKAMVDVQDMTEDGREALPSLLSLVKKVGENSDATTAKAVEAAEESRRLLANLADNTTPLPKWIRYPAQIVGLFGSAAVPVLTLEKLAGR